MIDIQVLSDNLTIAQFTSKYYFFANFFNKELLLIQYDYIHNFYKHPIASISSDDFPYRINPIICLQKSSVMYFAFNSPYCLICKNLQLCTIIFPYSKIRSLHCSKMSKRIFYSWNHTAFKIKYFYFLFT